MVIFPIKKRRGQIRGIDFTISLVLFILMFSQLILVIFNARTTIVSQLHDEEDSEFIANRLFGLTGPENWVNEDNPLDIGLKSDAKNNLQTLEIDAAKLLRFKHDTELINQRNSTLIQNYISYETIKEILNLDKIEFSIKMQTIIELKLEHLPEFSSEGLIRGEIRTSRGFLVSGIVTKLYGMNVENNTIFYLGEKISNSTGYFSHILDYYDFPFVIFGISEYLLGVSYDWVIPDITGHTEIPIDGKEIPTAIVSTGLTSAKFVDFATEMNNAFDTQSISILTQNTSNNLLGGYSSLEFAPTSSVEVSYDFTLPSNDFCLAILNIETASDYFFKIESLPIINDGERSNRIEDEDLDDILPTIYDMDEYRFYVYVRNIMLEVTILSWRTY